jgi:hypothetical protein
MRCYCLSLAFASPKPTAENRIIHPQDEPEATIANRANRPAITATALVSRRMVLPFAVNYLTGYCKLRAYNIQSIGTTGKTS